MEEDEWDRIGLARLLVDEVDVLAFDCGCKVVKAVRFLSWSTEYRQSVVGTC